MRLRIPILLISGLLAYYVYFLVDRHHGVAAVQNSPQSQNMATAKANPSKLAETTTAKQKNDASQPTVDQVRSEVAADPHITPGSVIAFADAMAPRMTEALSSIEKAKSLSSYLAGCVEGTTQEKLVPSIKALCLVNLQRLAEKYPELQSLYAASATKADDSVKSIVRNL